MVIFYLDSKILDNGRASILLLFDVFIHHLEGGDGRLFPEVRNDSQLGTSPTAGLF